VTRRERGEREYRALIGMSAPDMLVEVRERSPQLYDAIVEGAFGGPLARAELSRDDRQIATVAMLAA
jgi:3-oxoadipate enol-lactonase